MPGKNWGQTIASGVILMPETHLPPETGAELIEACMAFMGFEGRPAAVVAEEISLLPAFKTFDSKIKQEVYETANSDEDAPRTGGDPAPADEEDQPEELAEAPAEEAAPEPEEGTTVIPAKAPTLDEIAAGPTGSNGA